MIRDLPNSEIIGMLGKNFRQYRLILGMTQAELAQKTNISPTTIHLFENGRLNNLTLGNLLTLMRHVGIIENVATLIPVQPESPYAKPKTRVRHARSQYHKD